MKLSISIIVFFVLLIINTNNTNSYNYIIEHEKTSSVFITEPKISNQIIIEHKKPIPIVTAPKGSIPLVQKWSKEQVINRIIEVFGDNSGNALKIAKCESGYRDNAISSTNDYGVFQIHYFPHRGTHEQLLDAEYNIQLAYRMSGGGTNWSAWTCRKVLY
jgi:hypothetical protein